MLLAKIRQERITSDHKHAYIAVISDVIEIVLFTSSENLRNWCEKVKTLEQKTEEKILPEKNRQPLQAGNHHL